jgi:hypothetical protein
VQHRGLARIQIDDPETPEVDFRAAEFAIFRTLSPKARVDLSPSLDPSSVRILIDRGDAESGGDWLDMTQLFAFNAGAAEGRTPHTAQIGSLPGPCERGRAHPEISNQTIVVLPGANRLRVFAEQDLIASVHFLCYGQRFDVIAPVSHGVQTVPGAGTRVAANELS